MKTFLQFFEDTRRDFLKKLGMGISGIGSGINPLKAFSKDDEPDDDDDNEPWGGHDGDDYGRFDFSEWFGDNVLDIIFDNSIGDNKISKALADKIESMVVDKVNEGGQLSIDLMNLFDKHLEMSNDKFYETLEDPYFLQDVVSDLSFEVIKQLGLKQLFASAARREQRGDKEEDILKDVKAKVDNPIEYSKFDTAGGKRDYEYTADSYKPFDSLCESFMENIDKEAEREKIRKIFLTDYGDNNPSNRELTIRTIKQYGIDAFMDAFYIKNKSKFRKEAAKFMDLKQGRRDVFSDDDKIKILQMFVPAGEKRKITNPNSSLNGQVITGKQVGGYAPGHTLSAAEIARVIKNNPEWHLKRELTANEARFIKQVTDRTINAIIQDAGMSEERGRRGEL